MNTFLFFVTGVIAWRLYTVFSHLSTVPSKIPWVGRKGSLTYLWDQLKAISNTPSTISEAYHKYSKHGLICAIPLPFSRPEILLPRSLVKWMISQDESQLSPAPIQMEIVGAKYGFGNPSVHGDFAVYSVLRANMNRQLPKLIPAVMDELSKRIDEHFGQNGEWQEMPSHDLVRNVVARISTRVILGSPLCDNEKLMDHMNNLATCLVPSALVLRLFPPFLHPIFVYITHSLNLIFRRRAVKVLGPYIEERLKIVRQQFAAGNKICQRDDVLSWIITDAVKRNENQEGLVDRIACRVFVAMFAAMETTTMTISFTLLDLCASDPAQNVWEGLAEEGRRIFSAPVLDLATINISLPRADSSLKETLRLRTSIKALATEVTSAEGLVLEGYDVRLPLGSRLSVSAWGIHRDEAVYGPNASEYDAFRFSRQTETELGQEQEQKRDVADGSAPSGPAARTPSSGSNLMVTATENYLPFGMGKHSCPGRYFAAVESKLFLAYLAANYDLKLTKGGRPNFVTIGHFPIPPMKGKLMVRRKK